MPVLLAGCVADPPPPRVPGDQSGDGAAVGPGAITVVLDALGPGFNPHLRADMGADTDLLSALTLPSAYVRQPDGSYIRNSALVTSVTELPGDRFTLRYTLADKAQWSDGVPIGVEDFRYLWQRLAEAPGTVSGARGYRHVTSIRPGAGGKVIDVEFDERYPRWRELFDNLLPAHLMGAEAGSFDNSLAHATAASGGPFKVSRVDLGIGEIVLVRNDRYWDTPAAAEQIVLQSASDRSTLGQAARSPAGELLLVANSDVNRLVVDTVGGYRTATVRGTAQLNLSWNVSAPGFDSPALRRALTKFVDAGTVAQIATGESDPKVSRYPSGPALDKPDTSDTHAGRAALSELGFVEVGGTWKRDGVPLEVTLGVEAGDQQTLLAAQTVADQLKQAGIDARAWELESRDLYSGALPYGLVQGVVSWAGTVGDPLSTALARYGCEAGAGTDIRGDGSDSGKSPQPNPTTANGTTPAAPPPSALPATVTELQPPSDVAKIMAQIAGQTTVTGTPTVTIPVPRDADGKPALPPSRSGNVSGICDPALDAALRQLSDQQAELPDARPGAGDSGADETPTKVSGTLPYDVQAKIQQESIDVPLAAPQHLAARSARLDGLSFTPTTVPNGTPPTDWDLFVNAQKWRLR